MRDALHLAGGLLVFDCILSEAFGLDTPAGAAQRQEPLSPSARELAIVEGNFLIDDSSLGARAGKRVSR